MPRRLPLWLFLWTATVIVAVLVHALWIWHPEIDDIESHLVRELRAAADEKRLGSASLVLLKGGEVVAEHGFGPARPDRTLYLLASVSKAVTTWGVMNLVEDGKLRLDEPVVRRLTRGRLPPGGEAITVRHLLSHTAGIEDGAGTLVHAPGTSLTYSTEGYTILQRLIEEVTGGRSTTTCRPPCCGRSGCTPRRTTSTRSPIARISQRRSMRT